MAPITSKILEEPIDWSRDETRAPVPSNASIHRDVNDRWHNINTIVFDNKPLELEIRQVEESLLRRKDVLDQLNPEFDWKHDFEMARWSHAYYLDAIGHTQRKREQYINFWKTLASEGQEFYRKTALEGLKLVFLLHGAIALGGLGVLTQASPRSTQLTIVAKLAVWMGAFGILMAALGLTAAVYFGQRMISRIQGKVISDRWSKIRAIQRYVRRYGWRSTYGDRLVYLSIIWFAVYVLILLVLLVSV